MAQYNLLAGNTVMRIEVNDQTGYAEITEQRLASSAEKSTYSGSDVKTVHTAIKVK